MRRSGLLVALAASLGLSAPARAIPDPEEAPRQFAPVEEALASWDVPSARRALEVLSKGSPRTQLLDFFAGRVAFEEGSYEEAVRRLEAAGLEESPGSYLQLAKDTAQVVGKHRRAESAHFVILHPPGKDEVLVPWALETLEAIRTAIAVDLDHSPAEKVRVEIVNDARELARVSTLSFEEIRTTGTIAICKFNKLMITSPKAVLRGYDWRDTLAHEYVHLVVSQRTHNEAPIWIQEGLAKYLESRWRGPAGLSMPPPTLALLGERVRRNTLVPFAKMHPSIAKLPSHEDAAVAFAEVFYAVDWMYRQRGPKGLQLLMEALAAGEGDRRSVEAATGQSFAAFEKAWLAYLKKLPYPKWPLPTAEETVTLREGSAKGARSKSTKEIDFWDFAEVREPSARRAAHLGELMRERNRMGAAAEAFERAYREVGDRYPSVSNKLALSLLALRRLDEAERVLQSSLKIHPGAPATQVHLGRIFLARKDGARAKASFLEALASDPFDPEIHLSLIHVARLLKEPQLEERARHASVILTGLGPEEVERVARKLAGKERDLADTEVPATATDAGVAR